MRGKWRTLLTMALALIVGFSSMFGLSVRRTGDTAVGAGYQAQKPTATIRLTPAATAKRNGADPNWTKNYLSWSNYTTYATALQSAGLTFTYTMQESVPVRQTASFKAQAGTADQPADKTGGEFTMRVMYTAQAQDSNDFGNYAIVQGKQLNYASTTDTTQALLSQSVADKNKLKVGDTFTVANPNDATKTTKLKVQGIYKYTGGAPAGKGSDAKLAKDNRDNAIYVGYYAFGKNGFDATKAKGWAIPDLNIIFILGSAASYNQFVQLVKKAKLPAQYKISSPSLNAYEAKIAPLTALASRVKIALIVLWAIVGVALLALVIVMAMQQGEEIANGLIIGVSKTRIAWQLMLETLFQTLPAFAVGALAAGFCAGPLGAALAGGNSTPPVMATIWQVTWCGLAGCAVLALIAMQRAVWLRTTALFTPREEVTA